MENAEGIFNVVAGLLAVGIFVGGMLMMFTTVWTSKR
ncbi:hypothetical protein Oscil6304_2127 [Oscillatoria acuminata PCC 6304]|uniref:Uncharacterized protein n=1 Tax=Oscillatoria acuminata PCC 6304 TaxID=56110 RepID=K9TI39_9CYAN|nr:hypothetical protein Oscil6304_2127 [Oscillatoria acuminata PCC 6304]